MRAYWKFDGDSILILDETINSNTGVTMNNPTMDFSSLYDKGLYCDGVDDYVEFGSLHNSKFTEYTVQSWVKLANFTSGFGTVFGTVNDGRTWLGVNSENYFEFRVFSGNKEYRSPITNDSVEAKLDVWYNLAATYSESQDLSLIHI